MRKKPSISFFCPAYNDEKNLPRLIPAVISVLRACTREFEIIIVHDGSPDNTGKVADLLAQKYAPFIHVVHHKKNKGYGAALRSGFSYAKKYEMVFYTDGDYQYDMRELPTLLKEIDRNDVVIGYRRRRVLTVSRQIQTFVFNFLVRFLFGLKVRDINCSMKLFRREALDKIILVSNGSFIEAELLLKLSRAGCTIKEVPVTHLARKFGKASGGNPSVILQTLRELFRELFSSWRE